jgi:hypothetical protein
VAARKFGPIARVAAAHHFGSDIHVVEETLRDNPVSICRFRPSIARGAGADLHTPYGLAPDQARQCVFRLAVSGMPSLRTVDPAEPDANTRRCGLNIERVAVYNVDGLSTEFTGTSER